MTGYSVILADSARRELKNLPAEVIGRVMPRIRELASNPRPPGCKKLYGSKDLWRIRVGDYRIVYTLNDPGMLVDITRVAHRSEVYER